MKFLTRTTSWRLSWTRLKSTASTLKYASEEILPASAELPPEARVVICGGGAQGAAIAHSLAQRGLAKDVVILDKGQFSKGTTAKSSGTIPLLKPSPVETKLAKISQKLYMDLEARGYYTGYAETGSLYLATDDDRMHYFKRVKSTAVGRGVSCEVVDADKILSLFPKMRVDDLKGGLYVPEDAVADPVEICLALALLAHKEGVTLVPDCQVTGVVSKEGFVHGVETNLGFIRCQHFVNTAGIWARHIGTISDPEVKIPMHAAQHYILKTKQVPELETDTTLPVVRDPDKGLYFRETEGRLQVGSFDKVSLPVVGTTSPPPDWDNFYNALEALLHRLPFMDEAYYYKLSNDPEPYSPDGEWIIGSAPEIQNYYVAAGMRSIGVGAAGGVGELVSDLITEGRTPFDMYNLDIQRFLSNHNNSTFLYDRVKEVPGKTFQIPYPFPEYKTGRALRTSPIFTRLRQAGAKFNQVMGYERPMYFSLERPTEDELNEDSNDDDSVDIATSDTFYKPIWFPNVEKEFIASRQAVSLCDYSSFAKIEVQSPDVDEVVAFMQRLCSNDVDIPVGGIIHTGMQNEIGGYENDSTLARMAPNRYMLMSPSIQQTRAVTWMKRHLKDKDTIRVEDESRMFTCLCLMGPRSRDVLAKLTDEESLADLKSYTATEMDVGCAPDILTMTLTHTGELGYVFYVPNEMSVHVFDKLVEAGAEYGLTQCGYYAMRALRIEKFYAFWGQDLDSQSTPLECGRLFRTKMSKPDMDFIGRDALQRQRDHGIKKMLVMLLVDNGEHDVDVDPWPWGGEPIYRDGMYVGSVTTTSYGFSLKKHVAIGFVHRFGDDGEKLEVTADYVRKGAYELEIAGIRYPCKAKLSAPVLPTQMSPTDGGFLPTRHDIK